MGRSLIPAGLEPCAEKHGLHNMNVLWLEQWYFANHFHMLVSLDWNPPLALHLLCFTSSSTHHPSNLQTYAEILLPLGKPFLTPKLDQISLCPPFLLRMPCKTPKEDNLGMVWWLCSPNFLGTQAPSRLSFYYSEGVSLILMIQCNYDQYPHSNQPDRGNGQTQVAKDTHQLLLGKVAWNCHIF